MATDEFDHPTLTTHGRAMLQLLREHPHAPRFTGRTGSRLTVSDLEVLRTVAADVEAAPRITDFAEPDWLRSFVVETIATVPFHRRRGVVLAATQQLDSIPTTCRADLSADIAAFVPDSIPIDRLITYETSGTTGHRLQVPSEPSVAAHYLPLHRRALARFGVTLEAGAGDVGCVLLGMQQHCFTYVSVMPLQSEAGLVKCNLHPDDWRSPADRKAYFESLSPELLAGDPISFLELLDVDPNVSPKALLSTSMALSRGLRAALEERFGCPVVDLYSMNEAGPIAVAGGDGGFVLLQPGLHVEIVDDQGRAVARGVRGEITLTGGFNRCLPLLRYRTGDMAALDVASSGELVLIDLVGRKPVRFLRGDGRWVNNVDVLHAMQVVPVAQFSVHQCADESVVLSVVARDSAAGNATRVISSFLEQPVTTVRLARASPKCRQFTTDLPEGLVV
jgi:phenylacetate-CoA ligase